jgi:hypothetical protein
MPNMIQTEIMQDHRIPIAIQQLLRNMSRHIIIHFRKVLARRKQKSTLNSCYIHRESEEAH